jgi:hypothetical protein
MYDLMVRAVVLGDTRDYIALAGTMAHYVGDACQPLHVSRFHHGRPGHPEDSNVHGDYETKMLDRFAAELVDKVNTAIGARRVTAHIAGGDAAAALVVDLMDRTIQRLSPEVVVNAWIATKGHNHISDLWNLVGDDTAACIPPLPRRTGSKTCDRPGRHSIVPPLGTAIGYIIRLLCVV